MGERLFIKPMAAEAVRLSVVAVEDGWGRFRGLGAWPEPGGGSGLEPVPPWAPPEAWREVLVLVAIGIFRS